MKDIRKYVADQYRTINPKFSYPVKDTNSRVTFIWDGAAINKDGDLILIEHEGNSIVDIHIQSHVSRSAMMLKKGENITKLVWVTPNQNYPRLRRVVEDWRSILLNTFQASTPSCEYWNDRGNLISITGDLENEKGEAA